MYLIGVLCSRGREAKGGILSSLGNMTEAIKEKFTGPKDTGPKEVVEHNRYGGGLEHGGEEGEVEVRLKQSEQIHGQTFNDPGPMGEEGTGPTGRSDDRHGKM